MDLAQKNIGMRGPGRLFDGMAESNLTPQSDRWETRFAVGLFCLALAFHFWGALVGWKSLNLPGCEFRQTQTGVSAFFIQREHNFSLAYPTPVLGKPWSIPLEFPLYQWTVVWVSNGLKMPLTQAARAVSLVCFYLSLPALYLLLGRIGLTRPRRLLVLGLVVTCPLYVFYARAFLIETMALMFGAWFMVGYVLAVERKNQRWLVVATLAGAGCGLVKVTTFFFFLMPALLWTFWWFWNDWKQPANLRGRVLLGHIGWCLLAVVVPFAASIWWVHFSNGIKSLSIAGNFLLSNRLTDYNFGNGVRFSTDLWREHWQVLFLDLTSRSALVGCAVLAIAFARRWWRMMGALVFLFFAVQVIFPILYAWHEYYYVASAFTLMMAFGLALCGVFESRLPRLAAWVLVLAVYGLQMNGYVQNFYPIQRQISGGGNNLTLALKSVMAPDEVMVVAGDDWNSMTPYYAQRRALMIRRSLEHTWSEIIPAFDRLKDEEVTALVLHGEQAKNQGLIQLAVEHFHLDPRPAFRWRDATVYVHAQIRPHVSSLLKNVPEIELLDPTPDDSSPLLKHEVETASLLRRFRDDFGQMTPVPFRFYTTYGLSRLDFEGHPAHFAHPDTRLSFHLNAGKHTMMAEVGMDPGAYAQGISFYDRTDGVEIRLEREPPSGGRELLFSRLLNPRDHASDRGLLTLQHAFELSVAGTVVLSVGPGPQGNYARDWTILGKVEFK